ncbi:efflux RND transporter periplasmic adaptor subunit [Parabacteroides sp. Marseille-P3160]|uniref:efflux RND transporter periplasmic adaptor subunit n=1 Tax=Parabacteroides sp. Marseille-P3160 TaxID=1917887 RepID=UPI0009B9D90B|nr:efflux RND transporter periplasmic adaptor subunit [Parabacteroides sp. Marseille-P3160]
MNVKVITLGVTGALSLLLMNSCGRKQESAETPPQKYPTEVLSAQSAELQQIFPVTIRGREDVEISPRVDGFIDAIYVDEGSVVRKGQALFKINSPKSEQDYNTAKAAVESAQASVNTAKLNVDRIRPLAEEGIVSQVQLQTYENAYKSALAAKAQTDAALANARATLSWATVTSPVDGVVGTITYRLGSLVNSANILTTVANIGDVYAYFSMNEKTLMNWLKGLPGTTQAEKIKQLPPVSLILADGSEYEAKGKIETISGVVNVTTGSANFRAQFPNEHGLLRSGTSGRIVIPQHMDSVLVIPQKSTTQLQNKYLVFKVQGDSVVQKTIEVLPMPDGKRYVITEGLSAGDRIVTDGAITLKNGQKIAVE